MAGDAELQAARTPRYRQMADELRLAVLSGELEATGFPTENVLCERYGVSRFTVREALRVLQGEGLIQRRRGSGTVVRAGARAGTVHEPLGSVADILSYARDTRVSFEAKGAVPLPAGLAREAGVTAADGLWPLFAGLHRARGEAAAVAVIEAYLHPSLAAAADRINLRRGALFRQAERLTGLSAVQLTQDIRAVPASKAVAEALGLRRGAPCLRILRGYLDAAGEVVELAVSHHPGDRFTLSIRIDMDSKRVTTS